VSRSSAEAEYRTVANGVAEATWLRQLLQELHAPIHRATLVYCDNISAKGYVFPTVENKMGGRELTSPRSNLDRGSLDERQGFNEPKGYLISNPERGSHDGPLGFNEPAI
jgi:hypothetical protein